jgi:hypothetical protein
MGPVMSICLLRKGLFPFYRFIPNYAIFAAYLKISIRHIAFFLAALFTITFVPFNAFHHHEEDEHTAALLSHQEEHSCELDKRFCQDAFTGNCEHGSHISTSDIKCFSCQFHFIKTFTAAEVYETNAVAEASVDYFLSPVSSESAGIQSLYNKGPPQNQA